RKLVGLGSYIVNGASALMKNDPLFGSCTRLKLTHSMKHALSPATTEEATSSSTPKACRALCLSVKLKNGLGFLLLGFVRPRVQISRRGCAAFLARAKIFLWQGRAVVHFWR